MLAIARRNHRWSVVRWSMSSPVKRVLRTTRTWDNRRRFLSHVTLVERRDLVELGTPGYGSWIVPLGLLGPASVCYLAGAGEDISFDLELVARCRCPVHLFDPVP